MTLDDRAAFAEFMVALGEAYGEPISDARLELYFAALEDLPLESIRRAATIHVKTSKFFPRVSELREGLIGTADDRAEVAWGELLNLVRRYGYVGVDGKGTPPKFPDEVMRRAAYELYGSWTLLCERLPSEGPEFIGIAKQFKAAYAAHARRTDRLAELPPPDKAEAKALLHDLRVELVRRGLPAPGLPTPKTAIGASE